MRTFPLWLRGTSRQCVLRTAYTTNTFQGHFRSIFNAEHKAQFASYHDDLAFLSHSYTRIPKARVYCNSVLRKEQTMKSKLLFCSPLNILMSHSNSVWHSPVVVHRQALYTEREGQKAQTWKWHLQQTSPDLWPVSETRKALISRSFITVHLSNVFNAVFLTTSSLWHFWWVTNNQEQFRFSISGQSDTLDESIPHSDQYNTSYHKGITLKYFDLNAWKFCRQI